MDKQSKKEKAQSGVKTEPESGTALTSGETKEQKDNLSSDFFYIGEKAVAYFKGRVCWYRPGLEPTEFQTVNFEVQKRVCSVIHKCPDANDFEIAESGTKKLGEKLIDELAEDLKFKGIKQTYTMLISFGLHPEKDIVGAKVLPDSMHYFENGFKTDISLERDPDRNYRIMVTPIEKVTL